MNDENEEDKEQEDSSVFVRGKERSRGENHPHLQRSAILYDDHMLTNPFCSNHL